ncbi:hypothetical protein GCM10020295_08920 [Streptomyces cinereospinus]
MPPAVAAGYAAGRICGALAPVAASVTGAPAGAGPAVTVPRLAPGPQPGGRAPRSQRRGPGVVGRSRSSMTRTAVSALSTVIVNV